MEVPEQVLITGSLIRGTAAVGVPVTNLSPQDFRTTGALTTSDLFRTVPQFNVIPGPVATQAANVERGTRVNLRQLDTGSAPRSLMMVDGMRYPAQGMGLCQIDPSIIPTAAVDRVDLLLDGASATYGSDAIGGVINIILKRAYDGAVSEIGFKTAAGGGVQYLASQLWGRTWDGGDITLGYNWYNISPTQGNFSSKFTFDFSPWGLDNRNPLGSSMPGTISTGAPANTERPIGQLLSRRQWQELHELLRHPRGHRPGVQSDQWRHRSDRAVQRLDPELGNLQRCGQYRPPQRHGQRIQSLFDHLLQLGRPV